MKWAYRARLWVGLRDRKWRVLWTPATLHPALTETPAIWNLRRTEAAGVAFVDRDGKSLPEDGPLQPYLADLSDRFGDVVAEGEPGLAVELTIQGSRPQLLKTFSAASGTKVRTTVDRAAQAAAEKAAALLGSGMSPGSGVACPNTTVTGQRTINNHDKLDLGATSLSNAFAHSCNTAFAKLGAERAGTGRLAGAAEAFGFGGPIGAGMERGRTRPRRTGPSWPRRPSGKAGWRPARW